MAAAICRQLSSGWNCLKLHRREAASLQWVQLMVLGLRLKILHHGSGFPLFGLVNMRNRCFCQILTRVQLTLM